MAYKSFGLAALLVSALRSAVADPAVQEQVDAQQTAIDGVRSAFDGLTSRIDSIVASNDALDADQSADLAGIKEEMAQLATALTGPADDPEDNGVIAEVEPVDPTVTSPAADEVVEEAAPAAAGEDEQQEEQQQE